VVQRSKLLRAQRVRRLTTLAAERALAEALSAEQQAAEHCAALARQIRREIEVARDCEDGDPVVEALGAWLTRAEAGRAVAETALERASATSARARAALAAARSAEESLVEVLRRDSEAEASRVARRVQLALEDALGRQNLGKKP
jgi:hypothetical protein